MAKQRGNIECIARQDYSQKCAFKYWMAPSMGTKHDYADDECVLEHFGYPY